MIAQARSCEIDAGPEGTQCWALVQVHFCCFAFPRMVVMDAPAKASKLQRPHSVPPAQGPLDLPFPTIAQEASTKLFLVFCSSTTSPNVDAILINPGLLIGGVSPSNSDDSPQDRGTSLLINYGCRVLSHKPGLISTWRQPYLSPY